MSEPAQRHWRHFAELSGAMLLISTSGPLGRHIAMPAPVAIWWRALLAAFVLAAIAVARKDSLRLPWRSSARVVLLAGVLLGTHWISYFHSLQRSSVAIGMLTLFTFPVMTALLEPITLGTRFRWRHLGLAVMVLLGLALVNPGLRERPAAFYGMLWGLFSALCFTLRNLLLKPQVQAYAGTTLMFYQLLATVIAFLPVVLIGDSSGLRTEWPWLLVLACVTTGAGHTLYLMSLRHFSVSTASIMAGSQPVFGILLGALFLSEVPSARTLAGGALILGTVLVEAALSATDAPAPSTG